MSSLDRVIAKCIKHDFSFRFSPITNKIEIGYRFQFTPIDIIEIGCTHKPSKVHLWFEIFMQVVDEIEAGKSSGAIVDLIKELHDNE